MIPQLNIFMFLPTLQLAQLYDSHINSFNSYSATITHLELYEALEVEVGVKQKEPEYIASRPYEVSKWSSHTECFGSWEKGGLTHGQLKPLVTSLCNI